MQITHNAPEVSRIVLEYIQSSYNLDDSNDFNVEANEDGSITVYVNEEVTTSEASPTPTGERPAKKPRRSKAQIEADNKAEAARKAEADLAAAGGTQGNAAASTEKPVVEAASAVVAAAGETTPEVSGDGEATSETAADPIVETPVVVEEAKPEVVAEAEPDVTPEVEPERKPTTSLFANLRKPNNQ